MKRLFVICGTMVCGIGLLYLLRRRGKKLPIVHLIEEKIGKAA